MGKLIKALQWVAQSFRVSFCVSNLVLSKKYTPLENQNVNLIGGGSQGRYCREWRRKISCAWSFAQNFFIDVARDRRVAHCDGGLQKNEGPLG